MNDALQRSGMVREAFSPSGTEAFLRWLAEPVHPAENGAPAINRYLDELYRLRSDVRDVYPVLDGAGARAFIDWVWMAGRFDHDLCERLLPPPSDPSLQAVRRNVMRARLDSISSRIAWRAAEARDLVTRGRLPGAGSRLRERIEEAARRSILDYRAGAFGGTITLIRSAEYRVHEHLDRWYSLGAGGVVETHVAGTHRSMLREPNVASLAKTLRELIDATIDEPNGPSMAAPAEAPAAS
jgi:hypothetical protein